MMLLASILRLSESAHRDGVPGVAQGFGCDEHDDRARSSHVSLPYLFEVLWAPLVDRYRCCFWAGGVAGSSPCSSRLWGRSRCSRCRIPTRALGAITVCAVAIVLSLRLRTLRSTPTALTCRCRASAVRRRRRRTSATGPPPGSPRQPALLVADYFGWRLAFLILAAIMAVFCLATWSAPSPFMRTDRREVLRSP